MAMVIKNNMAAQMALGELNKNNNKLSKSLRKVASGMKINSAEDDASGYAISERMQVQIRGLGQDIRNAQNAVSMLKVAEGAAQSTIDILRTLKEKAINAANDTNTDADRATIQKEVNQYVQQMDDNAAAAYNGKPLFTGETDVSIDVKSTIVKALNSEWINQSLTMIKDAYGLSFEQDGVSTNYMNVEFQNLTGSQANSLAYVSYTPGDDGSAQDLKLVVNMSYYANLNETDVNGSTTSAGAGYLDRTIAHELTHAVMAVNINSMSGLPLYIIEGSAEFTHGIDDQRKATLSSLDAGTFSSTFSSGGTSGTATPYAVGYAFLHYVNKAGGHGEAMQRFMTVLNEKGGTAYDEAIAAATRGKYKTASEATTAFLADYNRIRNNGGSNNDFYKTYCDMDLENTRDTGSVMGSKSWNGEEENAENVVLEGLSTRFWYYPSGQTSTIQNLVVDWGDYSRPAAGFKFQIGTKANQAINAAFSDIHAEALGLQSANGDIVSLATRADAKRAMTIFDNAIEKTLGQLTTIGALQSRMEYTVRNLTINEENLTHAESTIRDADMAREMSEYTKNNVLTQAAQAMLAQANQNSSGVLSLLQ